MTTTTRQIDEHTAATFWGRKDAFEVMDRFESEIDYELREDMVKLGCYLVLREQDVPIPWAMRSACRRSTLMMGSDQAFCRGERRKMESMTPALLARRQKLAQEAGISTQGKFYVGGLGRPNEPGAWVSTVDEARHTAEVKNLECDGVVTRSHRETGDGGLKPVPLAADIRDRLVQQRLSQDPGLASRCAASPRRLEDVRREVVARHGRHTK